MMNLISLLNCPLVYGIIVSTIIYFKIDPCPAEVPEKVLNIMVPDGFSRVQVENKSFALYLRQLNLKPVASKVKYYDGSYKSNQNIHYRIIDISVGKKNLQQCADAIIRLRAEYLYSISDFNSIHFNFTSGDTAKYSDWIQGIRPQVKNNHVSWLLKEQPQNTYKIFKKYLETIFMYSGSYSLKKELLPVEALKLIDIGNVFIQGGFPGHAIIVLDMAKSLNDNQIAILLAQSYMPAQDIHILVNENNHDISPWYIVGQGDKLYTPEWTFDWSDLY